MQSYHLFHFGHDADQSNALKIRCSCLFYILHNCFDYFEGTQLGMRLLAKLRHGIEKSLDALFLSENSVKVITSTRNKM